jgi:hypothetical protein
VIVTGMLKGCKNNEPGFLRLTPLFQSTIRPNISSVGRGLAVALVAMAAVVCPHLDSHPARQQFDPFRSITPG